MRQKIQIQIKVDNELNFTTLLRAIERNTLDGQNVVNFVGYE